MEWGVELWDQFENVDKHLHHGIDFSDKYMKFVQDRCSAEQDYAKQLRRLVKKYQPKKKDDDSSIFSTHKAFQSQLSELNDIAGQHEVVAETMMKEIVKSLQVFINELRMDKKKFYQEGRQLQTQLDSHEKAVEKTKKKFEAEFREYERTQANYEKLDADVNVTKAEVDKAKQASIAKKDSVDACKADYASMLTKFNKEQTDHYKIHMPKVFEEYRQTDEKRIKKTSEVMVEYSKADSDVKPIINKCLEGMKRAAQAVDANLDAKLVVEKYKSGFYMPKDKEFEDYTAPQQHLSVNEEVNSPRNSINLSSRSSNKKGLSWLFGGKKVAESADYSHLPPEQRKKKLQKHIDELRGHIAKEIDGRNGLKKMQDVYKTNSALGDPSSLDGQLREYSDAIEKLERDLAQYENWYLDAAGGSPARQTAVQPSPSKATYSQPLKTKPDHDRSQYRHEDSFADEFEEEGEAVGTCTALYAFEETSPGSMAMAVGDKFSILEVDKGDGWTRILKDEVDGYVPTSYLDITLF